MEEEKVEAVTDFIFLGSKITEDGDCSHEIKRCFLLGRIVDKPRQCIKKQRHHFADKGPYSHYGFSSSHVQMWELDQKAECQRTDAFELWWWRRLLRVPWTARRSNHSILREIDPEYSLEGPMLKLQYFGHLMQRANSVEKTPKLGRLRRARGEGNDRGWDG